MPMGTSERRRVILAMAAITGTTRVRVTFMGPYTITYVHAHEAPRRPNFPYGC